MHPAILELATQYGVEIEDRSAFYSTIYNGKSIATHLHRHNWWYTQEALWGWVKFFPFPGLRVDFSDHEILHEVAHFVVASPEQRKLPEYGLGHPSIDPLGNGFSLRNVPITVELFEGTVQEFMAEFLCVLWGRKYNISPKFSNTDDDLEDSSWDRYLKGKILSGHKFQKEASAALFRLKRLGFLSIEKDLK